MNGATTGDFTNYFQLKAIINSGKFQLMVFQNKLMPPLSYSKLTTEEIALLKKWVDAGAIEN